MIVPAQAALVVIATRPIDFRRSHDSLPAYAQNELKLDPHSEVIMVLTSPAPKGLVAGSPRGRSPVSSRDPDD